MAEGCVKCLKCFLLLFDIIFFISGMIMITAGGLILYGFHHYLMFLGDNVTISAIILMVAGSIVFLFAVIGCFGVIKEHHCLVSLFAAFLCLILILEIASAGAAFTLKNQLKGILEDTFKQSVQRYYHEDRYTVGWDRMQEERDCCGATNYTDWTLNTNLQKDFSVPKSCCTKKNLDCPVVGLANATSEVAEQYIYTDGCITELYIWANGKTIIIAGIAVGLAFLQIVGIILAICLARCTKDKYGVV